MPRTARLNRKQKLLLKKLDDQIDRITQADRAFFKRRPDRVHRVRLASQAEIKQEELMVGGTMIVPAGYSAFIAVRNVAPGIRLRVMTLAPEGAETDLPEEMARLIFEKAAPQQLQEMEADLRNAFEVRT
jgi:hypothetical protein